MLVQLAHQIGESLKNLSTNIHNLTQAIAPPSFNFTGSSPLRYPPSLPITNSIGKHFFEDTVGMSEKNFRDLIGWDEKKAIATKPIANAVKWISEYQPNPDNFPRAALFVPGQRFTTLDKEQIAYRSSKPSRGRFTILYYDEAKPYETDIYYLQAQPINKGAVFQIASTFFGPLEGGMINPKELLSNMKERAVQGEYSSMGGIGATIWTKYFLPSSSNYIKPIWPRRGINTKNRAPYLDNYYYLLQHVGLFDDNGTNEPGIPVYVPQEHLAKNIKELPQLDFNVLGKNTPLNATFLQKGVGILVKKDVIITYGINEKKDEIQLPVYYDPKTNLVNPTTTQIVSQIFCSAINLGSKSVKRFLSNPSSKTNIFEWAKIILKGSYQATIFAAANIQAKKVYLTMMGGGAFNNDIKWIAEAIEELALNLMAMDLEVILIYRPDTKKRLLFKRDRSSDAEFIARMVEVQNKFNGTGNLPWSQLVNTKEIQDYVARFYNS